MVCHPGLVGVSAAGVRGLGLLVEELYASSGGVVSPEMRGTINPHVGIFISRISFVSTAARREPRWLIVDTWCNGVMTSNVEHGDGDFVLFEDVGWRE